MPSYKVVYFNGRGRAEILRLTLAQAGQEFEDVRIERDQWAELKPKTPTGQMPYMEVDGRQLGQSMTCARYIAREYDLLGGDAWEEARVNQVIDTSNDLFDQIVKVFFAKAEEDKVAPKEKITVIMQIMEKLLQQNDFYVGNSVTLADLAVYTTLEFLFTAMPESKSTAAKMGEHFDRVASQPLISAWLAKRPTTPFWVLITQLYLAELEWIVSLRSERVQDVM